MHSTSDDTIVRRIRAGEASAFALLYERHKNGVFAYCFRLLKDGASAEDALQTVFTKALESLASLDDPAAFKYWLFMIARNEVYGAIRRLKNPTFVNTREDLEDPWDPETPQTQAEQTDTREIIQRALLDLRPEYREVLILREYEQFSYTEIAALTGDSEGSVKARIFKARKALAKRLGPYFNENLST